MGTSLAATALLSGVLVRPGQSQQHVFPELKVQPALGGNRAPYDLVFSADGRHVYVTEFDEGEVAVIERATGTIIAHLPTGGTQPTGLALTSDGKTLLVTNSLSGSLAFIDVGQRAATHTLPLVGAPYGVAVEPGGQRAFVSVSQLDEVAVVEVAARKITARIPVGRRPRALALAPDGKTLAVANMTGGSVSVINLGTLQEEARVNVGGVNLRGITVSLDGDAYVTVSPPRNGLPTASTLDIWHNFIRSLTLAGPDSARDSEQWLDFAHLGAGRVIGSPDQHDLELSADSRYTFVTVAGRHVLTRFTTRDNSQDLAIWPTSQIEVTVGANPRGLALSPDGREVWVCNHLGNSISVVDARAMRVLRTIDLGPAEREDRTIRGRFLFNSAHNTRDGRFTCNSCHPDGASDGLVWEFVHVWDGFVKRNTRDLRGGLAATPPFRWSGHEATIEEFAQSEVDGLFHGPKLKATDLRAIREFVHSLPQPPNPYRSADGALTAAAQRGEALFRGKANCASCHAGALLGGTGKKAHIGTTRPGLLVDVPHLKGGHDSPPYLHDGRAKTLAAIFTDHDRSKQHGGAHLLSAEELAEVVEYVRQQ